MPKLIQTKFLPETKNLPARIRATVDWTIITKTASSHSAAAPHSYDSDHEWIAYEMVAYLGWDCNLVGGEWRDENHYWVPIKRERKNG